MTVTVRLLGPDDEPILSLLATHEAEFDLEERGTPLRPLEPAAARSFLLNPAVLFWIAVEDVAVIGFLYCILLPLRAGVATELLLYEIGVRTSWRKRGTGRTLLTHMENWMRTNGVETAWVCSDNQAATDFYRACGFAAEDSQPVYMQRHIASRKD